jgi:hypothetical protein
MQVDSVHGELSGGEIAFRATERQSQTNYCDYVGKGSVWK